MTIAALFLAALCGVVAQGSLPLVVLLPYLIGSVAAFVTYRADKAAARLGAWRTRESTFHVLALIGGWPGGLIAQAVLRHKSRKRSFQVAFWTMAVINCGVLFWFWQVWDR